MTAGDHRWRFFRAGGSDQVRLDEAADLESLGELDQKLWVALSCSTHGLECDERTLAFIDTDKDGRIRAPDVIAAVRWTCAVLKDPGQLVKRREALSLSSIDDEEDEGKRLLASARQILVNLGKADQKTILLSDVVDRSKIFGATKFNGDGVVPAASADDAAVKAAIEDVVACVGSEIDRSGEPGLSRPLLDRFYSEAEAYSSWWKAAEGDARSTILPLGEATGAAWEAFSAVRGKLDDYFARSRLAAFDARSAAALNGDEAEYTRLASKELKGDELAGFPLARVEPNKALPLVHGLNPAWSAAIEKLRVSVVAPLLGDRASLSEADRDALVSKLAPYGAWIGGKAGASVDKLGLPRVRALLEGTFRADVGKLLDRDEALRPEAEAIESVERLVRYNRDLHLVLENFVNFRDFYSRKRRATFQAGTLYIDGRSCDLCLRVASAEAHSTLATRSRIYLAYCDCTRKKDGPPPTSGSGATMTIAAAITAGNAENLMVGRNGVFYDRKGDDWDATIVKILEHPISIREAFWLPYRRLGRLIGEQIEKLASSRDTELQTKAAAGIADTRKVAETAAATATPAPPAPPFDVARFAGIFAAIGLAIGAIGSVLAAVTSGFLNLPLWQMPLAVGGVVLLVSGPSMVIAWLKLRQRNLGPILDANGWAVNGRARLNIPFGGSLTVVASLPYGAERSLADPFEGKRRNWGLWLVLAAILAAAAWGWHTGLIQRYLGL